MSIYRRQVEIASGGANGIDFELYDESQGLGVQIRALKGTFVEPTEAEIASAQPAAVVQEAELASSKQKVKDRPTGGGLPALDERVTSLEAIVADLIADLI